MNEPRASRAGFPGYGITEDAEGMLPWSWAVERLAVAHNYWVATASSERGPHTMPVWGLWHDDAFVFSTGAASRKARNLAADPRIVVHLESGDEVVLLEGSAEPVERDDRGDRRVRQEVRVPSRGRRRRLVPRVAAPRVRLARARLPAERDAIRFLVGGFGEIAAVSPGRAERRDAASSVAPIATAIGAPCVLASHRPSHPSDEHHSAKPS